MFVARPSCWCLPAPVDFKMMCMWCGVIPTSKGCQMNSGPLHLVNTWLRHMILGVANQWSALRRLCYHWLALFIAVKVICCDRKLASLSFVVVLNTKPLIWEESYQMLLWLILKNLWEFGSNVLLYLLCPCLYTAFLFLQLTCSWEEDFDHELGLHTAWMG